MLAFYLKKSIIKEMEKMEKNAYWGFIVGDCLGVPYEFRARGSFTCSGMIGGGAHNQPAGTWSDDTSMMLATIDAIAKGINKERLLSNFLDWFEDDKYTQGGRFDIGGTTMRALQQKQGASGIRDNGNGSLMRMLPLVFGDYTDQEIIKYAGITHNHYISHWCCLFYVYFGRELVSGTDKTKAYHKVCKKSMKFFPNQKKNEFRDILSGDIQEKETDVPICEGGLASNGYVVNTLESVLWCILNYDNYEEAVLGAVNLGEDTDTVGALVGGLAAILWEVPEKFTNKIRNKEIAEKIIKN